MIVSIFFHIELSKNFKKPAECESESRTKGSVLLSIKTIKITSSGKFGLSYYDNSWDATLWQTDSPSVWQSLSNLIPILPFLYGTLKRKLNLILLLKYLSQLPTVKIYVSFMAILTYSIFYYEIWYFYCITSGPPTASPA